MNKKIFSVLILGIFLFSFISAVESNDDLVDYSEDLGIENVSISGTGIDNVPGDSGAIFRFKGNSSVLTINESVFRNIKEGGEINVSVSGEISSADFVADRATNYSINGIAFEAPANSKITYSEKGGLVIYPEDGASVESFEIPEGKSMKINGANVNLPKGNVLNYGEVTFNSDGSINTEGIFVKTSVNGVKIKNAKGNIPIYFDSEKHTGEYISFNDENVIVSGKATLEFTPENPYVKIQEGDKFLIEMSPDSKAILSLNKDTEFIPDLELFGNSKVIQDSKNIRTYNNFVFMRNELDFATTSPMKISFHDKKGRDLFFAGGKVAHKDLELLVDNFNRFAIIPKGSPEEFLAKDEGIMTKFSSRISYNYMGSDELAKVADGKLNLESTSEGYSDMFAGRIRDYWENLPKKVRDSVNSVNFYEDVRDPKWKGVEGGNAYFDAGENSVNFYAEQFSTSLPSLRHEISHAYVNKIFEEAGVVEFENEEKKIIRELESEFGVTYSELEKSYQDQSIEAYKVRVSLIDLESEADILKAKLDKNPSSFSEKDRNNLNLIENRIKEESDKLRIYEESYLSKTYETINKKKIDRIIEFVDNQKTFSSEWAKISSGKYLGENWSLSDEEEYPKDGFIRAYGTANEDEDYATFSEKINTPEFFKDLINPAGERYHPDYRKKINAMYDMGAISKEEYQKILDTAGVK